MARAINKISGAVTFCSCAVSFRIHRVFREEITVASERIVRVIIFSWECHFDICSIFISHRYGWCLIVIL